MLQASVRCALPVNRSIEDTKTKNYEKFTFNNIYIFKFER